MGNRTQTNMKRKDFVIPAQPGTKELFLFDGKIYIGSTIIGFLVTPYSHGQDVMNVNDDDVPKRDAIVGSITMMGIPDLGSSNQLKGVLFPDGSVDILGGNFESIDDAQSYIDNGVESKEDETLLDS